MAELAGSPWRGAARADVFITLTPANRHSAWCECTVGSPAPTGDQAIWEGDPGSTLTLRFKWQTAGTGSGQQTPNFATIDFRLPGGAVLAASDAWSVTFPAGGVEVTKTFNFTSDPFDPIVTLLRSGMIEVYLIWGSTGGVTPWSLDSRGATTGTILGTNTTEFARGYFRSPVFVSNDPSPSNVSIGGAVPSVFAFPDPIHTRVSLTADKYRSVGLELELVRTGTTTMERESTLTQTAANHDYSWTGTTGNNRRVGNGMFFGSEAKDLILKMAALDFGGDNEYVFAASGHAGGWTRDSDLQMTNASELTVDPRLCVRNDALIGGTAPGALFHPQSVGQAFFDPPSSGDIPTGQRSFPNVGYLSVRYANARTEGQNSLNISLKVWDADGITGTESTPTHTFSGTTATRPDPPPTPSSPQVGWLPLAASGADENKLPLVWSAVAAGTWRVKSVCTAPVDAVGLEAYPLTDGSNSWNRNLFFVTISPNISAAIELHPENIGSHGTHLTSEDEFIPVCKLWNNATYRLVDLIPANGDTVYIFIDRTHHPTMRLDYFDFTTEEWVELANDAAIPDEGRMTLVGGDVHSVGGDPDVWTTATHLGGELLVPDPAGELDFVVNAVFIKDGVNYTAFAPVTLVGPNFKHNSYSERTMPHDSRRKDTEVILTGTASVTLDSGTVTGSGTLFLTELAVGRQLRFGSDTETYEVFRVDSNTSLRMSPFYTGTTGSGKIIQSPGTGHVHTGATAEGGDGSAPMPHPD